MDKDSRFASCLGWIVAWLAVLIIGTVMNGWALSTIWNWYIPPIFGLVGLSMMKAVGVSMVFSLFTGTNKISSKSDENESSLEKFIGAAFQAIFTPLLYVAIAYIILQFAF